VAVQVMTAYRVRGHIFLRFLTTALYGVSSTIDNHLIRAGMVPGMVLAFLEVWNAVQPTTHSTVNPDCLILVQRFLQMADSGA